MKNKIIVAIALALLLCTSCIKSDDYKLTEFLLTNHCDQAIEVTSSALVRYNEGWVEESLIDHVSPGETLLMRKLRVVRDFSMSSVFTKIEIRKGNAFSTVDALDRDRWVKTLSTEDKDEYTLTVDASFFN